MHMNTNPIIIVMVGLPGCGKSTYVEQLLRLDEQYKDDTICEPFFKNYIVISSDNLIEQYAKERGLTYTQVFKDAIKGCEAVLKQNFKDALADKRNIVYDQTNLTKFKRMGILSQVPKDYHKIVVRFSLPLETIKERLLKREAQTGKRIPWKVVEDMLSRLEEPKLEEGFDELLLI